MLFFTFWEPESIASISVDKSSREPLFCGRLLQFSGLLTQWTDCRAGEYYQTGLTAVSDSVSPVFRPIREILQRVEEQRLYG